LTRLIELEKVEERDNQDYDEDGQDEYEDDDDEEEEDDDDEYDNSEEETEQTEESKLSFNPMQKTITNPGQLYEQFLVQTTQVVQGQASKQQPVEVSKKPMTSPFSGIVQERATPSIQPTLEPPKKVSLFKAMRNK